MRMYMHLSDEVQKESNILIEELTVRCHNCASFFVRCIELLVINRKEKQNEKQSSLKRKVILDHYFYTVKYGKCFCVTVM